MILADKNAFALVLRYIYKKKSTMTYHRPLFTGNVLKVRLSCKKNFQKNRGKNQQKNHGKGKKIKIGYDYIPLFFCSVSKFMSF